MLLKEDNTALQMAVESEAEPQEVNIRNAESTSGFANSYLTQLGPGLPSVLLHANYNNETGSLM